MNANDYNLYTYDKNGNVLTERKRNATTITNTYDANNRLTFRDLSDNTYSGDVAYEYDLRGLTLASCFGANQFDDDCDDSGAGETNYFDGFGNLTSRISRMSGTSRTLSYQYDLEGNRARINHPGGVYFTYNRDGLNRVCTLGESAAAEACGTASPTFLAMRYSNEGRRDRIFRPGGSVTTYGTDNALRLSAFTQDFAGSSNNTHDLTNGFGYNPASQIRSLTQSNLQYNYTEADNRVGAYGVDGLNRYTSIDGVPTSYDVNGNLTADGTGMTYTYDMENRLVATGGVASTLTYDVLGRLARVSVAGTTTDFHYDGDALVGEHVVGIGQTRRYVHSGGVDEPLVQYNSASIGALQRRYLYADHQGSIIAHSDNAGLVTQKNAYDPYGIPKSTNDGRFGYTGQTWIPQLGLNYYKARIYAPKLGRFLQTDPIFYKDDMNLYAYVGNDPLNQADPSGTQAADFEQLQKRAPEQFRDVAVPVGEGMAKVATETAKEVGSAVADSLSVKATMGASGGIGVSVSATADRQTLQDGTIGVSGKVSQNGQLELQGSLAVNLRLGPKDIGDVKASAAVKLGAGVELVVGSKGVNLNLSAGIQGGFKVSGLPKPPSVGVGGSTRIDVTKWGQ